MARVRSELIVLASFTLTIGVIVNAFYQRHQFYPSVVYLTKSSASMAVSDFLLRLLLSINRKYDSSNKSL